ncbi:MAG: ABC transporter permease [Methanomassiliicoccales archaeon]
MQLGYYVLRRVITIVPTLLGLLLLMFLLERAIPASILASQYVNPDSTVPIQQQLQNAYVQLGLNHPAPVQFYYYLVSLLHGNLGFMDSSYYSGSVLSAITTYFPNTLQLVIFAMLLTLAISFPLGTYIGSKPGSAADHASRIFAITGYAIPTFWLGLVLQLAFGRGVLNLPISVMPLSGVISSSAVPTPPPSWLVNPITGALSSSPTHMVFFDALIHGDLPLAWNAFIHLVLPVITLTYALLAGLIRFIRSGMVDVSVKDFVRTARAKGVPEKEVIKRHVRRNALIPAVTVIGLLLADLLGGVVVTESVFQYPGMGLLSVEAAETNQIYGVVGTTLVFGIIMVITNLVVDIVYAYLDPRIRY